jgi:hypothetical protein
MSMVSSQQQWRHFVVVSLPAATASAEINLQQQYENNLGY